MLVGEGQDWFRGEEQAWKIIAELNPDNVSRRAKVVYDELSGQYILSLFGEEVFVSPKDRKIWGNSPITDFLLNELHYYSRLSILWYLIQAKDVPLSRKLINPGNVSGGLIFQQGSHTLPLDEVAQRYGNDPAGFLQKGKEFGGEPLDYGDVSLRLFPFPRVPTVLIIWRGDDEFSTRANLLFDSTCSIHLPVDIIWSTAMMSVLLML